MWFSAGTLHGARMTPWKEVRFGEKLTDPGMNSSSLGTSVRVSYTPLGFPHFYRDKNLSVAGWIKGGKVWSLGGA